MRHLTHTWITRAVLGIAAGLVCTATASGAEFPTRDITFIVPYGVGGPTDTAGRLLAQELEPLLGRKVIVINRPGASGTLGIAEVLRAKPDGYTIGYSTAAIMAFQPLVSSLPFKTTRDYQPIIKLLEVPVALAVSADSPLRTFQDFLGEAKSKPGALRVSVAGKLTEPDLVMELLKSAAGIDVTTAPFTGGSVEALTALLGGHVDALAAAVTQLGAQVEAKKIRLLTVFQKGRHPLFPDTPSSAELGYDVRLPAMHFLVGPNGMERAARDRLVGAFRTAIQSEKFQAFARKAGLTTDPIGPEALEAEIKQFAATYARLLRDLGIEAKR
jgi:tripartite-type tricarboxylate transporter receptor subunit TctC